VQDRTRINTGEDYELRYWSENFGVSQKRLKAVAQKVGNSVSAVEKELRAALLVLHGTSAGARCRIYARALRGDFGAIGPADG
jgi:hypothetical protein